MIYADGSTRYLLPKPKMIFVGLALISLSSQIRAQTNRCTLCYDGSEPDMSLSSESLGWSCTDLQLFADILTPNEDDCVELQIAGFQDCNCPTYPPGFCTLCPGGFSDIPDRSVSVPSTTNLTCGDILFVEESLLANGCQDLAPYRERCGCPIEAECTFCADGSDPRNRDRVIPYLSVAGQDPVTCGENAAKAFSAPADRCNDYTVAPVAVNPQGYCGCPGTFPSNLCSLCPNGQVVNSDIVVPQTGGLTCSEMETYLSYITDEDACRTIAETSHVCCRQLDECPVCPGGSRVEYNKDRLYEPYGLTCENIGLSQQYGFPMTCEDVQTRFPFYCGCPDTNPSCTLCQLGELPPEMEKEIPLLSTTCEEVNDFLSLRLTRECAGEAASLSFAASAYCGCTGFTPPDQCSFCGDGQIIRDLSFVPEGAQGATCGELQDFSRYVRTVNLCIAVQNFAPACCSVPPGTPTMAPTTSSPIAPTDTPSPATPTTPVPTNAPTTSAPAPTTPPPPSSALSRTLLPTLAILFVTTIGQWVLC